MTDLRQILEMSQSILLVDWPHTGVPRTLLDAGFAVFGFSRSGYSAAEVHPRPPDNVDSRSVFPPKSDAEKGFLVFRQLDAPPARADIVNVYRPEAELAGIIAAHVVPLAAKVLWLHPPLISAEARRAAGKHGITFVEGSDIAETTRSLGIRKSR